MAAIPKIWAPFKINTKTDQNLFESEEAFIDRSSDLVRMDIFTTWNKSHLELAQKFGVACLRLSSSNIPQKTTVKFLCDLPRLRALHLVISQPLDLSAISKLPQLEYLGLVGKLLSSHDDAATPAVDFSKLPQLKAAFIQLCRPTESILNCSSLESLNIWDEARENLGSGRTEVNLVSLRGLKELRVTQWPKLKSLDLTAQAKLERLELYALPKLRSQGVSLHPKAILKSFGIGGCGAYRIEWERVGRELDELALQGPLRFPFEDVLKAPNLRKLSTNGVKKFPSLKFLLELKKLRSFSHFNAPPGPKFSEEDYAVIRKINERDLKQTDRRKTTA